MAFMLLRILYLYRKETNYITKSLLLKFQNFGVFLPSTKILTYSIAVTFMITQGELTLEKAIRLIGWMEVLTFVISVEIPSSVQFTAEMVSSVERIEVLYDYLFVL